MRVEVRFEPKGVPVIAAPWLERALTKEESTIREGEISLHIKRESGKICLNATCFDESELIALIPKMKDKIYAVLDEGLIPLEIRSKHYYKLKALDQPKHPTLEIDGIHMHRISRVDPWKDTLSKIRPLKIRKGEKVLDTCMGLGYTAIAARRLEADVITVEKNEEVIELATWNPWSSGLKDVKVIMGDVSQVIKSFDDESFDKIIHDPPAFSIAGELYSYEFYLELYRVLKSGGRLFHYTGAPSKSRPFDITRSVMKRLSEVGFIVKKVPNALGVLATKPY